MRSIIVMLLCAWMLAGCACGVPQPPAPPPRQAPAQLLDSLPWPATLPAPETASGPDLLASYSQAARLYHSLRARYLSLVEWARLETPDE